MADAKVVGIASSGTYGVIAVLDNGRAFRIDFLTKVPKWVEIASIPLAPTTGGAEQ